MRSPIDGGRRTWNIAHSSLQSASRRVPLYYRVLFANAAVVVLGAEAHHESAPDRAAKGLARSLQVGVRLAAGFEVDLFDVLVTEHDLVLRRRDAGDGRQ